MKETGWTFYALNMLVGDVRNGGGVESGKNNDYLVSLTWVEARDNALESGLYQFRARL